MRFTNLLMGCTFAGLVFASACGSDDGGDLTSGADGGDDAASSGGTGGKAGTGGEAGDGGGSSDGGSPGSGGSATGGGSGDGGSATDAGDEGGGPDGSAPDGSNDLDAATNPDAPTADGAAPPDGSSGTDGGDPCGVLADCCPLGPDGAACRVIAMGGDSTLCEPLSELYCNPDPADASTVDAGAGCASLSVCCDALNGVRRKLQCNAIADTGEDASCEAVAALFCR